MPKIDTLDPTTPLGVQLQQKTGPIVLINTFFVPREVMDDFLAGWQDDAAEMKKSPGFISTQLHRGIADSQLVVNVAVWESTEALAAAHANPAFREKTAKLPEGIVSYPHVFEKVAVEGICVAA